MQQLQYFQDLVQAFNWHTPSWDLFILLVWLVASVMYAFAAGRGRILTVMLSIFMAKLLVLEAPFLSSGVADRLNITMLSLQQLATFGILFIVFFIFLGRYVFKTSADTKQFSGLIFSVAFSFLQVGLLINCVLTLLPLEIQENFSTLIQTVFIHTPASFIWLILPVLFLVILGRFVSDRSEV
jgi:hypothetical protein